MGETNAAKIQLTAQCAYLNLQEGNACEAILKETRELWQKSGRPYAQGSNRRMPCSWGGGVRSKEPR